MRLNAVSRTKSELGRVVVPRGASNRRPLRLPATIRIAPRSRSGERRRVGAVEQAVGRVVPGAVGLEERACEHPRALEELSIDAQSREPELADAGLAHPEQLALAAQLEVALGEHEAVTDLDQRLETGAGGVGE